MDVIHQALQFADENLVREFGQNDQTQKRQDRFRVWIYFGWIYVVFALYGLLFLLLSIGLIWLEQFRRNRSQSVNKKNPEPMAPGQS